MGREYAGWYLGFVEGSPSTNNGTEGKNGTIKKYHTKYVKNGLMEANAIFMDMVRQWSAVYKTSKIECQNGKITDHLKREAYLFADSGLLRKGTQSNGGVHFFAGDVDWKKNLKSMKDFEDQHKNIHVEIPGMFYKYK